MAVTITHSTPADGTFSATGAAAWDASHSVSGLGTMAEQNSNNVNITGGSITGVTGVLTGLTVNSTPTSGGAAGQIMFDTGSVLQESSNLVWDNTAKRLTLTGYSLTGTSALSQLDLSGTWNTTGTPTLIKANVTNTASNTASLLIDLQVGGSSIFSVSPTTGLILNYSSGSGALQVQSSLVLGSFSGGGGTNLYTTNFPSASDQRLGYFIFGSTAAGTVRNTAIIQGLASGAWTDGSSYPTYLSFAVVASGATARTERLRILSTGNLNLGPNTISYGSAMGSEDLFLTRRGAANLRFGAADAAAPVAQTLSVQSVVAGTSNTAGANLTITGSQGTGTGAGGSIIFQVAPAGSSGTAQNALVNSINISPSATWSGSSYLSAGTPTASALAAIVNNVSQNALIAVSNGVGVAALNTAAYATSGGGIVGLYADAGSAITSGSRMGGFLFGAASSASALRNAAIVAAFANQNWVDASAYGSRIEIGTTANSSTTRTTRLIVGNSGIITFGATEANTVPALKPSSTTLQVRLADDSAYAPVEALTYSLSTDVILSRRAAANLRLGAADAAAPVAQTLSVQSVVAGTSNTAGANLTITGSQGTGTGAGGSIIFQVAPAGSSGTAQNALSTALTINSLTQSLFSDGSVSGPSISFSSASNTGIYYFSSGFHFAAGGANIFGVRTEVRVNGSYAFGFTSGTTTATVNDVLLTRRAAANLRLGAADAAAPVAQTLSVQSVVAGTSNTAGANLTITGSQGTGTGAGGSIIFQVAPAGGSGTAQNALATALTVSGARQVYTGSPSSALLTLVTTANAFMVSGASTTLYAMENTAASSSSGGAFAQFFANSGAALVSGDRMGGIQIGGSSSSSTLRNAAAIIAYASQNWVDGTANGSRLGLETTTNGSTSRTVKLIVGNSGIITFGATEANTVPALKPSSTILQVRLADDSAYAPVEASTVRTATAYTVATLPAAGTAGRRAYVTDATAPTWLGALIGGGTVVCPVFDNGTAWVAG